MAHLRPYRPSARLPQGFGAAAPDRVRVTLARSGQSQGLQGTDGAGIRAADAQQMGASMTTFDDRDHAFEAKFVHDEELQFKADARRNKLLGLWAAGLMGKEGDEALDYARSVIASDLEEVGHEDVYRKVAADLGDLADEATIRAKMDELMAEAKKQIMTEV
ncbi:hypothetical protein EV658_10398 [Phaeovulum veldkampii DSM 11550]|nr:hypothetical protein EV658_10398 [Phaeovulum veldkampii DSM 11550]